MPAAPSLRSRVINAGSWVFSSHVMSLALSLGSNLIMTRLLVPEMFGVMSVSTTIILGIALLSDAGIRQYILNSPEGEQAETLDTAWAVQIIRGLILYAVASLIALLLLLANSYDLVPENTTYEHPDLPYVLLLNALSLVLGGFQSTRQYVLNRKIQMKSLVIAQTGSQFAGIVLAVLFASFQPTVWSLVVGSLSSSFVLMLLTHFYLPGHKNTFRINRTVLREMIGFGKWILFSSIAGFFILHADRLWFGGLISAETLGVYNIAFLLMAAARQVINKLSDAVLLPALSHVVRERPADLSKVYYKSRLLIDSFTFTSAGFLMVAGPSIVRFLYDSRYHEAGHFLSVIAGLLLSVGYLQAGKCLVAMGHVKQRLYVFLLYAVVLNLAIPIMFRSYGFEGALLAIVVAPIAPILAFFYLLNKYSILKFTREIMMTPMILVGFLLGWALQKFLILVS